MDHFNLTKLVVNIIVGGIGNGLVLWLAVKIVDNENNDNNMPTDIAMGLIIQALFWIPGLVGIVISLLILAFLFRSYDLGIGEGLVALLLFVILLIPVSYLTKFIQHWV